MCEQAVTTRMQVNDNILNFDDLLEQILNGVFQMNLPASFKNTVIPSKTTAIDEFKQAAAGNNRVGNGNNKKKQKNKNGIDNLVRTQHKTRISKWQQANCGKTLSANNSFTKGQSGTERSRCAQGGTLKATATTTAREWQAMSLTTRSQPKRKKASSPMSKCREAAKRETD